MVHFVYVHGFAVMFFFFFHLCFYRLECRKIATGEKRFNNIRKENLTEWPRFVFWLGVMIRNVEKNEQNQMQEEGVTLCDQN